MNLHDGYRKYRSQSVLTAGQGDLVLMLYDGCLRQLKLACGSIDDSNYADAGLALVKAQDFVGELIQGLDFHYELSRQLLKVYDYVNFRLIQANISKDGSVVRQIEGILREMRETWEQAMRISRGGMSAEGA